MSAKNIDGNIGTTINVKCFEDVSTATTMEIVAVKPDHTFVTWTASLHPTDNTIIQYATISGDIDQAGEWFFQPRIVLPAPISWDGRGQISRINFGPKVEDSFQS